MHFFGSWGTVSFIFGLTVSIYLTISKFFFDQSGLTQRPLFFIAILAMIIGTQLFLTGFIAELITRNSPEEIITWWKRKCAVEKSGYYRTCLATAGRTRHIRPAPRKTIS
jgi:hypothetical protein